MKMMKGLLCAAALLLSACGTIEKSTNEEVSSENNVEEEVYTFKVGHIAPPEEAYALGFEAYAEAVREATEGRIQFEIHGNGSLGGERELLEAVQLGTLDMSVITTGVVSNFVPDVTALEFPFLYRDLEHAYKTLDSDIGQDILDKMSEAGFKGIAFWANGQRHLANNKRPIRSPEDLKGLKMRTIESELLIDTYSSIGTNPTPMAFPEVYGGLQQGVIDGTDQSYGVIWSTKTYEQLPYFSESGLYYASATLLINQELFESLPEDLQETIVSLGKEFAKVQREISEELEQQNHDHLIENGVEIIPYEEVDIEAFRELVQPVYEKYADEYGHYIDRIQVIE
ncbi:TRAP transporter substrate-binding protein DctP [Halalkalibacter urbisdiaboli]|uniref:TRAP transporter substrate-binding protein DctP n=1 Tax=Halalkalibacter urbisdiaboli TaxID=1960589 RepID=UPI000B446FF3|nr:TRAP transporter substrate-binding protein DctP [Halalkalibacter urbisdiaboli]